MNSLSNRKRALLSVSLCGSMALVTLVSCRSQNEPAVTESASPEIGVSSTPPFQTKEPDRYRATRTITTTNANGETVITKTSIARDGEMRRNESETVSKKVVYLDLPEGRFVLLPEEKLYADLATEIDSRTGEGDEQLELSPERLLHTETSNTSYQKIGAEVIGGRNADKYRIVVNSSALGNVSPSETLIWIDEALNMPIRSETTSSDRTRVTMELSDIALDVDRDLFRVPADYEKVAFSELRKRLKKPA